MAPNTIKLHRVFTASPEKIFKAFRNYSLDNIYDFEHHVKIGETLDAVSQNGGGRPALSKGV